MKISSATQRLAAREASMTIEARRAAAVARVKAISAVVDGFEGEEPRQFVLEALRDAIVDVAWLDIEAYGRLTTTVANPDTKH